MKKTTCTALHRNLGIGSFSLLLSLLACAEVRSAEALLADAAENQAWQAIAERFTGTIEVKKRNNDVLGGIESLAIDKFKVDPNDRGRASVRLDPQSGRVIEINCDGAGFSNDEFKLFAPFSKLQKLTLWHNGIHHDRRNLSHDDYDAQGLAHLQNLKNLTDVTLAGGSFGDAGMKAAAELPHLKVLNMWHCEVNDAGIAHLQKHPTLEVIRMGPFWAAEPKITDKSLEYLATCPRLKEIRLGETWLTYEGGLRHLLAAKDHLQILDLQNSLLQPADVEKIKAGLPDTEVRWEGLAGAGKVLRQSASNGAIIGAFLANCLRGAISRSWLPTRSTARRVR